MDFKVESNRIFANDADGNIIAEVNFPEAGQNVVDINRTFVDPSLRGQGVAAKLMEMVFSEIEASGRKATLSCPYAVKWAAGNEKFKDCIGNR